MMTEEEDRIRAEEWYDKQPFQAGQKVWNAAMAARYARSEREARQPKIYKAPETPKVCEECDSTCFVTAGGDDLVCYHCLLVSKAESEREAGRREGIEQGSKFRFELETEADGRWIAEIPQVPGALAYGTTSEEAINKAYAIALSALNGSDDQHVIRGADKEGSQG